jgi:hypothetical protein
MSMLRRPVHGPVKASSGGPLGRHFEPRRLDGPVRGALLAWLLVAATLAGCGAKGTPTTQPTAEGDRMRVAGLVESDTLVPLANATVAVAELNLTVRTDDLGNFAFPPLEPRVYSVEARLAGYSSLVLVARPETNPGALDFVLQHAVAPAPRQDQFHFRGSLDCAYVSPAAQGSCDAGARLLANQTAFSFPLALAWRTAVVDVLFDDAANPGLAGLRLLVRGQGAAGGAPHADGAFQDGHPFTARLEPNATYAGGAGPVDANTTRFFLDVAPQGQLTGQACVPGKPCPSPGAGAGANIQFDLYVTVFYVTPAPEGFTLRTDA